MTFLDVFLKVIAILGIIAVGTFIIVFLSDLLISVIDNSNGIFFKRNKNANNRGTGTYARPKMITQKQDEYEALTYAPENSKKQEQPVQRPQPAPAPKSDFEGIDYEKAREEEKLAARASVSSASIDKKKAEEDEKTAERLRLIEARRREFEASKKQEQEDEIDEEEIRRIIQNASATTAKPQEVKEEKVDKQAVEKEVEERLRKEYEEKEQERQRLEAEERAAQEEKQKAEAEAKAAQEESLKVAQAEKEELDAKLKDIEATKEQEKEQLQKEIEMLKKQLETANTTVVTLTQQVNEKPEPQVIYEKVVTDKGMTKEEIEAKLATLKQRLKANEKELSQNKKDYLPLKRVNMTLASDEKKLRRKEATVAKKKVLLYGVNNYVDIDEEKAKELAEELDLLEGLKLSVQHCEEVMRANKDRYPILEKANHILTKNIEDIKADIAELEARLAEFPADDDDTDGGKKMDEVVEEKKAPKAEKAEKETKAEEKKETKAEEKKEEPAQKPLDETDVEALVNEILGTKNNK